MAKPITTNDIKNIIVERLSQRISQSGIMFRIFGRAKSLRSLEHKMAIKGEKYRSGKGKIEDMIGIRIVLYFTEDVDAVDMWLNDTDLVDRSADEPDEFTFRPQRLNLVKRIPQELINDFRQSLPEEYAEYLNDTYEIQIRTVFSEGWHEVEHDLRYKCKEDWSGCENFSRQLNGVIATLETAQWSMGAIFREMAYKNWMMGNYRPMLRNKLLLRLANDNYSPKVLEYLKTNTDVTKQLIEADRLVFVVMLLNHKQSIPLTYDNVVFLINRFEIMDEGLMKLESAETKAMIDSYLIS